MPSNINVETRDTVVHVDAGMGIARETQPQQRSEIQDHNLDYPHT